MSTLTDEMAVLSARVARLERQNRWLKQGGLAALVVVGTALLLGSQEGTKGKTLEVERLIVRDSFGRQRAALHMTKNADDPAVALVLYDENERPRAGLGVNKDGPGLYFTDANGKHRAVIAKNNDGIGLDLLDEEGRPRMDFRTTDKAMGITMRDEGGTRRMALMMEKDIPGLILYDQDGKARGAFRVEKNGAVFRIIDAKERPVFVKP
jgi:hypothetical protein